MRIPEGRFRRTKRFRFSSDADADEAEGPDKANKGGKDGGRGTERRKQGVRLYKVDVPRGGLRLEVSSLLALIPGAR